MKNTLLHQIQQTDVDIERYLSNPCTKKSTPLDTGLKWAPLTVLLVLDAASYKTKSSFKQHALNFIVAEVILNAAMLPVKKIFNRKRPNGQAESFPSGHAATGFLSSQILYEELRENNAALSYSGYTLSFVTCLLRLYHKKHWFSDVAAGALLGIFSAKASSKFIYRKHNRANKYLRTGQLLM